MLLCVQLLLQHLHIVVIYTKILFRIVYCILDSSGICYLFYCCEVGFADSCTYTMNMQSEEEAESYIREQRKVKKNKSHTMQSVKIKLQHCLN